MMAKRADAHKHQCLNFHQTQNENGEMDLAFHFVVFSEILRRHHRQVLCVLFHPCHIQEKINES